MTIQIEIKGMEEVRKFLANAVPEITAKAEAGIKQAGNFLQGEVVLSVAGQRAETRSVDTGNFMNSIRAVFPQPLVATVETEVEYAKFLEYGTSKIMPRMHFRNSLERNQTKIVEYIKDKIKV